MEIQFEEKFTHQVHGNLVPRIRVEKIKVVVDDDKQTVDRIVVVSLEDNSDDLEKIILIKGVR